jgi:7-cyano-7-deazaguanine synthase in queuosine biosynthesis
MMLANALVTDYLGLNFKFQTELTDIPTLAHDLLVATKAAIGKQQPLSLDARPSYGARSSSSLTDRHVMYKDPITEMPTGCGQCEDCGSRVRGYDPVCYTPYISR